MVIEITAYERPRRLALSTHLSAMDIHGTLTFDTVTEGTRMRWSWELEPRGVFKLMTPIVARMGQRQEETIWANLNHFLEEQRTPLRYVRPDPESREASSGSSRSRPP
jgi:hypothetical protein